MPNVRPSTATSGAVLPAQHSVRMPDGEERAESAPAGALVEEDVELQNVRVAVRVRPLVARERVTSSRECISEDEESCSVSIGKRRFTFDHVFGKSSTQDEIFDVCGSNLVDGCFSGYNATVLAYGQTGSGKTYTMGSGISLTATDDEVGIIPRAIARIYSRMQEVMDGNSGDCGAGVDVRIRCSFLEIYNEQVKDLLHPETPTSKIAIREHANGSIVVTGIREEPAPTAEALNRLLMTGAHVRTTGSTLMNEQSSRSHAVFSITVEQVGVGGGSGKHRKGTTAKFHLVDLAGSERNKKTGTVGTRFKESVTINQGLLALGNVISALGDERKRCSHVPYRESKLTRMLQDSLGGNSRTVMIACVSSAESSIEETVNTLKYAHRARNIKNKPIINRELEEVIADDDNHVIETMRMNMESMQKELMELENMNPGWHQPLSASASVAATSRDAGARLALSVLEEENSRLRNDVENFRVNSKTLVEQVAGLQSQRSRMQTEVCTFVSRVNRIIEFCADVDENMPNPSDELLYVVQLARSCAGAVPGVANESVGTPSDVERANGASREEVRRFEERIYALEHELREKTRLLEQREASLVEVQEDLARDEIIFAEKLDELRRAEARAESAEKDLHALKFLYDSTTNTSDENQRTVFQTTPAKVLGSSPIPMGRGALAVGHNPLAVAVESDDEVVIDDGDGVETAVLADDVDPAGPSDELGRIAAEVTTASEVSEAEQKRAQIKEVIDIAEREALDRNRAFEAARHEYEAQLGELSLSIQNKEQMIQELARTENEARAHSVALEQRAKALEVEVKSKEAEVKALLLEIDQLDSSVARTEDEKRKMRITYEEKLRRVEAQLLGLRQQRKEQEESRVSKLERKSELRVAALNAELERMRQQQDILRKKYSVAEERHNAAEIDHSRRTSSLKKEAEASQRRIKALEIENEKQRTMLKKKADEVAVAQRRLRQLEGSNHQGSNGAARKDGAQATSGTTVGAVNSPLAVRGGRAAGSASPSPAKTPPRSKVVGARRSSTASTAYTGSAGGAGSQDAVRLLRKIVHERVENSLREVTLVEEVSRMQSKKDELSIKRTELLHERGVFDRIRQQRAKELSNEIMRAIAEIENLTTAIEAHASASGSDEGSEAESMKAERRDVLRRKRELEEDKRSGRAYFSLDEERELTRLDDALDALDTEMDYLSKTVGDMERELAAVRANTEALSRQSEGMTLLEAKHLVGDLMGQLVLVKGEHMRAMHRVNRMDVVLAEKEKSISDLGGTVRLLEMSTDKRMSDIKKVHDEQVGRIVQQMSSGGMNLARMRSVNEAGGGARPLRSKEVNDMGNAQSVDVLDRKASAERQRTSSAKAAVASTSATSLSSDGFGQLELLDRRVVKSVALDRTHLQSEACDPEKTVRVSRSQLRPLSAADMQQRRARQRMNLQ